MTVREAVRGTAQRTATVLVFIAASAIAAFSARDYAGSWNDGSRLATVESLVDRHTFVIDDSIFVRPPRQASAGGTPYPPDDTDLYLHGTRDKLLINGRFYSDKSPVPGMLLAGWYQVVQWATGWTARQRPERFCYWMTLGSSGLAYVIAVSGMFRLAGQLGLSLPMQLGFTASFGLATVALVYARHVNNHILLLAVAVVLLLAVTRLATAGPTRRSRWMRLLYIGTLVGLGYTIDLGVGPLLFVCTLVLVAHRSGRRADTMLCALAALPWLLLHHAVNYAIGGTFRPANAVFEYINWPGSAFSLHTMTGAWHHTAGHFAIYAAALLVGTRGFLGHNLPLFLVMPGCIALLMRRTPELPEVVWAAAWSGSTWMAYAAASNNYSGACASIRWFVPLLAPGYYVLAVLLREYPECRQEFVVLSACGGILALLMWWQGPWMKHMVPFYWPLQALALATCVAIWAHRSRGCAPAE